MQTALKPLLTTVQTCLSADGIVEVAQGLEYKEEIEQAGFSDIILQGSSVSSL